MKFYKRFYILLLCIITITMSYPTEAFATNGFDVNRDVTLKIYYEHEGINLSDAKFDIYQVAYVDSYGKFTPTEAFSVFDVNFNELSDVQLRELVILYEKHIKDIKVDSTDYGKTNENGILMFPNNGKKLEKGVYLVMGDKVTKDGVEYNTSSFLISLPQLDSNKTWVYEVEATPKADDTTNPTPPTPPNIPQTGQLWWPVPILLIVGSVFIAVGAKINKGLNHEK